MFVFSFCPGIGELDDGHANLAPEVIVREGICYGIGKEIGVCGTGSAAANHLGYRQTGAIIDKVIIHKLTFNRPNMIVQPIYKLAIVGITSK